MNIGILAGGKSSRYGKNKILEDISGKTFLETICSEFNGYNLIISTNGVNYDIEAKYVYDENIDIGPIEGIRKILLESDSEYTCIVSGDTPLVKKELYEFISTYICDDYDIYVVIEENKIHPLCGIYSRKVLPYIKEAIKNKNYSVTKLIENLRTKYIDIKYVNELRKCLINVNYPSDKIKISNKIIAISGQKNSGKTKLICDVLPYLKEYFDKIIVIKHDGHDFDIDHKNTDTYKYRNSGANRIAIISDTKTAIMEYNVKNNIENILDYFKIYDLVVLEGFKGSDYPKIEVFRKGTYEEPVCRKNVLAIATDEQDLESNYTKLDLNNPKNIASFIIDYFKLI